MTYDPPPQISGPQNSGPQYLGAQSQGNFPNYLQPGGMLAHARTSAAAITSLVLGIIGCVPVVTSLLAVIFGIVGIRKTSSGQLRGRGLAIAGLVLGVIGLLGWCVLCVGGVEFYRTSRPISALARQFTTDLANGNVAAAQNNCDSSLTTEDVQKLSDQLKTFGTFTDLTINSRVVTHINGVRTWQLNGWAEFSNSTKVAHFTLDQQPDNSYKISAATFR